MQEPFNVVVATVIGRLTVGRLLETDKIAIKEQLLKVRMRAFCCKYQIGK